MKRQIACGGLMQGEQADTALVHLGVHPMTRRRVRSSRAPAGVAIDQRIDRFGYLALRQPAHLEKPRSQAAQLLFVLSICMLRLRVLHFPPPRELTEAPGNIIFCFTLRGVRENLLGLPKFDSGHPHT